VSNFSVYFEDVVPLKLHNRKLQSRVNELILKEQFHPGRLSIIFCSDDYLLNINKQFLGHDYYTDIVTFDYVEDQMVSGDLFISIDRVKENAAVLDLPFMHELYRVILHGVLHLAGYKDKTKAEQKVMREKEDFYLEGLIDKKKANDN
jgi:rRNA maturation RNase YbeY